MDTVPQAPRDTPFDDPFLTFAYWDMIEAGCTPEQAEQVVRNAYTS